MSIGLYLRGGGWEDLIGLLVLMELVGAGFLAGVGAGLIQAIRKRLQ